MIPIILTTATGTINDQQYIIWLYEEFQPLMYSIVRKYNSNPVVQEDIVQECVLKLIEKVPLLRSFNRYTLAAYIAATTRNASINELRKADPLPLQEPGPSGCITDQNVENDIIHVLFQREKVSLVWRNLSQEDRILLEGRYLLGYSDEEISEILKCKPSSIRMKMTRARRNAMEVLDQLEDD